MTDPADPVLPVHEGAPSLATGPAPSPAERAPARPPASEDPALARRETTVASREVEVTSRELDASLREVARAEALGSLVRREDQATRREINHAARAVALEAREAVARSAEEREALLAQMQEMNERLVLATLRAQELADEAIAARAATEVARKKLEETEASLQIANRRKDEFLAMLGHELRNPLAPILTAIELMKARGNGHPTTERDVIERQVRHMVELIDDLLDVSRITSGKIRLHRVPVEVALVVDKAVETASPLLESRRHTFSVTVPRAGLLVNGDPTRLAQVLANLLTNAAKYTDPGGRISLDARREEQWVKLSVVDDGSGISPELMPLLFEPFVQGPQTIARARGGLGLGLAIVRSLVELHGGSVSVSSAGPGRGSEFVVRLPWFEPTEAEVDVVPAPAALRAPDIQGASRRSRVLVVDDNVDAAEMLSMALQMAGWETDVAHDGLEALKKAASFDPDAVVIDIGLPIMDGYAVGRRLREAQAQRAELRPLRLVAVTGYGQEADRQQSAASGIDVHLVKPVDLDVLSAALVQPAAGGDAPAARSG